LTAEHVLITGGAGFIGSHLGDELLRADYRVRGLDRLVEQVHGDSKRPEYLADEIELVAGDVRNAEVVRGALEGVDSVVHLAARVGVGQSMYGSRSGFEVEVQLEDGMAELAEWLEGKDATDRFEEAADELTQRGLTS
jgi:nucleoside-diphosphate-sugar epimerase